MRWEVGETGMEDGMRKPPTDEMSSVEVWGGERSGERDFTLEAAMEAVREAETREAAAREAFLAARDEAERAERAELYNRDAMGVDGEELGGVGHLSSFVDGEGQTYTTSLQRNAVSSVRPAVRDEVS